MFARTRTIAAVLASAFLPAAACAQAALPDAEPAMWVVKDSDTTIYMLGTFHMLDGKRDWFNDEVKSAFNSSSELVLEAILPDDPAELQPLIMRYALDPQGRTLTQKLPPELKAKLDAALGAAGLPAAAFDPIEPWFVSLTLTQMAAQKLGLKPELGPESVLKGAATSQGKTIAALETAEGQIAMLDRIPEEAQVKTLGLTINQVDQLDESLAPMLEAWSSGDTKSLVRMMKEGLEGDPVTYKAMFTDRNARWAEWIGRRMDKPGTVFLAVGAGHLAGKKSVQRFLAKQGLRAKRVQ